MATTSAVRRNGLATTVPVSTPSAATGSDPNSASSTGPVGGLEESSCASRVTAGRSSGRATRRVRGWGVMSVMMGPATVHVHLTFLTMSCKLSFMLDVRRLRLLRELHERGTVTAVAQALAYTPSAVSQQLATLEREAGVRLVERHGRRLRLTDAGRGLVEHADAVIARLELAEAELAAAAGHEVAGRVRVAAFQTAAAGLVLPLLGALRERHPRLRLELLEMEAEEGLELLRRGEVELVLAEEYDFAPRPRDPGLVLRGICRDPLVLVLPAGHPLVAAHPETVPLAALAGEAW